jgi:hypothetical protein
VARSPHRDGKGGAVDPDLQGILDRDEILDSIPLDAGEAAGVLGGEVHACDDRERWRERTG